MDSRKSYGHKRRYEDRSTRQWNDSDDGWKDGKKERKTHHSDMPRDSFHKYGGDAYSSTERTRGNREYSDSPKRMYSKDSLNRDWSRRSPVRRHSLAGVTPDKEIDFDREYANLREESQEHFGRERERRVKENRVGRKDASLDVKPFPVESKTSPEWGVSKKKQQGFSRDAKDNFKYRKEHEDLKYRQSPDNFTYRHLKRRVPPEEDFKYREMPEDSKHQQQHEEFAYGEQPKDFTYRRPSGDYKDRCFQDWKNNLLGKRTQSQDFPTWGFEAEHDVTNQGPLAKKIAEQKTATKGFQRFLDVLNKGVDVSMLSKIVKPSSTVTEAQSHSPAAHLKTADPPSCTRQQESHQTTPNWSESKGCQSEAAQQQGYRHLSTEAKRSDLHIQKGRSLSDETSLQKSDVGGSHSSSDGRSRSPPVVEKAKLTPEDEHKRRQMQDVLQAIGMDLGFEELGQMSSRIQERLYGKKDCDRGQSDKEGMEKEMKQVFSPGHHSRSSSSGKSSFGSLTQHFPLKKDSCKAPRDTTEVHQTVEYAHTDDNSSNRSLQDCDNGGNQSQESTVSFPFSFSPNPIYTEPPPTPVMTSYSAEQYSPYTYPMATPPVPPYWGVPFGTQPYVPHLPWYHYPSAPVFTTQSNTFIQHTTGSNRQLTYLTTHDPNPVQPLNTTQKSTTTTLSRPRCLLAIDTKHKATTHSNTEYLIENVEELKKYFLSLEKVQKYSQTQQNEAFRVLLFNHRRLKLLAQEHKTHKEYLNDTSVEPNLDDVDCSEVASAATTGSGRIVPGNAGKKQIIKLRLCEQTLSDKPPGGAGGPGLRSEPGEKVPK